VGGRHEHNLQSMRFKIEYLSADGDVRNWVFPRALDTLAAAIEFVRRAPSPAQAVSVLIRDAERGGDIVWRGHAAGGDAERSAPASIEA
jgi:hypothetical protein